MNAIGMQKSDPKAVGGMYLDAFVESGRNSVSNYEITRFSLSVENERAHAGWDGRTRPAKPISQSRMVTGKTSSSLVIRP